jgi:four helix bundle protein
MQVNNFEDLEIWKDARALTRGIYQLTKDSKFAKDFALRDQIRRAAVSIMSNIAEGFERGGNVAPKDCNDASKSFRRLSIMISNLIDYLKGAE